MSQSTHTTFNIDGTSETRDQTTEELNSRTSDAVSNSEKMRTQRNNLLAETDWMAGSDYTMTDAWKTYRQALRDLPAADGFPDVDFPTKPSQELV